MTVMQATTPETHGLRLAPAVIAEIRAEMGRSNVKTAELARRLGVKPDWLQRRVNGAVPVTLDDLDRIAGGLHTAALALIMAGAR